MPPPRVHRHRYFGVLAPNSPLRAAVTALALAATTSLPTPNPEPAAEPAHRRAARYAWALLLARIYEVFLLVCPICGGAMRIIAFITDAPTVRDTGLALSVGTPASTRDNLIRWRLVQLNLLSLILDRFFLERFLALLAQRGRQHDEQQDDRTDHVAVRCGSFLFALVYPFESYHLGDMINWMRQYSKKTKREMDLADASLYWLAIETGVTNIMTTDIADFSRYRLPDARTFILLDNRD